MDRDFYVNWLRIRHKEVRMPVPAFASICANPHYIQSLTLSEEPDKASDYQNEIHLLAGEGLSALRKYDAQLRLATTEYLRWHTKLLHIKDESIEPLDYRANLPVVYALSALKQVFDDEAYD